jgi:hypothetical protein
MHFKAAATDGEGEFDPVVKGNETVPDVPTGLVNSLEKTIVEEKKLKLKGKNELNGAEDVPIVVKKEKKVKKVALSGKYRIFKCYRISYYRNVTVDEIDNLKLEKTVKREGNYPTG